MGVMEGFGEIREDALLHTFGSRGYPVGLWLQSKKGTGDKELQQSNKVRHRPSFFQAEPNP